MGGGKYPEHAQHGNPPDQGEGTRMKRTLRRFVVAIVSGVLLASTISSPALASGPSAPPLGNFVITIELVPVDPDIPIPTEGAANANTIGYNTTLWAVVWKCSYAGWEPNMSVRWNCKLSDFWTNQVLSAKTSTFSNSSANPGPWYYFAANSGYCVDAEAHYANFPSIRDTGRRCNVA